MGPRNSERGGAIWRNISRPTLKCMEYLACIWYCQPCSLGGNSDAAFFCHYCSKLSLIPICFYCTQFHFNQLNNWLIYLFIYSDIIFTMIDIFFTQEHEKKYVRPAMFKEVYSRIQVLTAHWCLCNDFSRIKLQIVLILCLYSTLCQESSSVKPWLLQIFM